jgi:hypothetical protein
MNYLNYGLIKPMVNKGKTIEQYLGSFKHETYNTIKWISIYLDRNEYCLDFHEVFDEREEEIESVYSFSYVEPDNMDGERIYQTKEFEVLMEWLFINYTINKDKFLPFDYLNEELKNEN